MANRWVTQLAWQVDGKIFKEYGPLKLQMQRETPHRLAGGHE